MSAAMTPGRKRIAMLIVAVGGVVLVQRVVALSADESPSPAPDRARAELVAEPKRAQPDRSSAKDAGPAGAATVRLDRLALRNALPGKQPPPAAGGADHTGLFEVFSWQPRPPVATAPPPSPQKPVAPPFPYAYMGGLSDDGVRTAFFMKGERVLPVKAGDVVDAAYRVDEMTDKQMMLTYLPLNETMAVALEGGL